MIIERVLIHHLEPTRAITDAVRSGEDAVTRLTKAGKTKPGRSMIKDIDEIIKQGMCHRLKIFQEDTRCQARIECLMLVNSVCCCCSVVTSRSYASRVDGRTAPSCIFDPLVLLTCYLPILH